MRYFGSKTSTLAALQDIVTDKLTCGKFCDAFGGLGTVGSHFKKIGFKVTTSDTLTFAHYFQIARVKRSRPADFRKLRKALHLTARTDVSEALNNRSQPGWLVDQFSKKRKFFSNSNALRINGCWKTILSWNEEGLLSYEENAVLLSSLINSMDRVANTAGTYYAHLKHWHRKALIPFKFEILDPTPGIQTSDCFHTAAENMVAHDAFDILYLDPPYNERNYSGYYHLPESIARGEECSTHGKSGSPSATRSHSAFNCSKDAATALKMLLETARFRLLVFHYSDDGIISPQQVKNILKNYGIVERHRIKVPGYTTSQTKRSADHIIYTVSHA